ncbi:fatty-acid amide hydrolase 2 isoform X1 [Gigaspora margarita]|uniref:Fatty-acid amide hydrolase 2 isoform X1 n=1 Tax=Gigaspora margarita TaxID=4874 RepID=A0A8H4A9H9_GIGMA|nr:fatty-acid amide hydrolase 2 isoform X1 [Gigaspora margarita]
MNDENIYSKLLENDEFPKNNEFYEDNEFSENNEFSEGYEFPENDKFLEDDEFSGNDKFPEFSENDELGYELSENNPSFAVSAVHVDNQPPIIKKKKNK